MTRCVSLPLNSMPIPQLLLRGRPGFTLIETILYTLIVTMIFSSFLFIMQAAFSTQKKFKSHTLLQENMRFSIQKIESRTHAATAITFPTAGSTSTRLVFSMSESSKNPTIFELNNGLLLFSEGNASSTSLLTEDTTIREFIVAQVATTPPSIRITLTAQTTNGLSPPGAATTIQETISLRR